MPISRVVRYRISDIGCRDRRRQNLRRKREQAIVTDGKRTVGSFGAEERAVKDASNVGIETGGRKIERKITDCRCRVVADSGDRSKIVHLFRKRSPCNDRFRRVAQPQSTTVVPKPSPSNENIAIGSRSQILDFPKLFEEFFVQNFYSTNLRLLKHDLGDKHAIRPLALVRDRKITPREFALVSNEPFPDGIGERPNTIRFFHAPIVEENSCGEIPKAGKRIFRHFRLNFALNFCAHNSCFFRGGGKIKLTD